jgi:dipeptidyl-peptidase 4
LSPPYPWSLVAAAGADRIAWVFHDRGARNVWTAAAPDFKPVNLTGFAPDEVFELSAVALTPDGSTALFVKGGNPNAAGWVTNSDSDPLGREQAVWAVRTDGGSPWKIATGRDPVISPDGRWAVLVRDGLLYRVPLAPRLVTDEAPVPELLFRAAGTNGSPRWSPDGGRIAFVSSRQDHSFIGVYDLARRRITWLAPGVDRDGEPRWTADGARVAFVRRPGLRFSEEGASGFRARGPVELAVWVADAATGAGREIWRTPKDAPRFHTFRNFELTAAGRILFTAEREEWNHVFSLPLEGGEPVDLTPGEGFVEHVALSSDGKTLFFSANMGDLHGRRIWKVPTAGGKAVALTPAETIGTYPIALASGGRVAFLHATAVHPTSVATVRRREAGRSRSSPRDPCRPRSRSRSS